MSEELEDAAKRLKEEQLYEVVTEEIKNNQIREGLMAKALVETSGNHEQARLLYIKYRIQSLIDEVNLEKAEENLSASERKESEVTSPALSDTKRVYSQSSAVVGFTTVALLIVACVGLQIYSTNEAVLRLIPDILIGAVCVIPAWLIFSRAGFSGIWALLVFLPSIGLLIAILILAFRRWPNSSNF